MLDSRCCNAWLCMFHALANSLKTMTIVLCICMLCRWFLPKKKDETIKLLQMKNGANFQHPDGAFFVRPSEQNPDDLSLSVRYISFILGVFSFLIGNSNYLLACLSFFSDSVWLVWRSGNGVGSINKVNLRRVWLVLALVSPLAGMPYPVISQVTLAHSAWPSLRGRGAVYNGDDFGHWRVLHSSGPWYQNWGHHSIFYGPLRPTQPGHPSMDRCNYYWQW